MKYHVFRPMLVAAGTALMFAGVRSFVVPADFGVHGKTFTYNFYRQGNIEEWKAFKANYRGKDSCNGEKCHSKNLQENLSSEHKAIECENCHGPNLPHLDEPKKFEYKIDRTRPLCLRCHEYLPYPGNFRSGKRMIDEQGHYPGYQCFECHNPHNSRAFSEQLRAPHTPRFKEVK